MTVRVVARLVVAGATAVGALATAVASGAPFGAASGAHAPAMVTAAKGDPHVDPLPRGVRLSDPASTAALYARAGLSRTALTAQARFGVAASAPAGAAVTAGLAAHVGPSCTGTGSDGRRVQVLYVREASTPSRFAQVLPLIQNEIANVDDVFAVSARKTGGDLRVRWVHRNCVPVVEEVVVPAGALDDPIDDMIGALDAQGYDSRDRKYLAFADAKLLCGIGTFYYGDSPTQNPNDGGGTAYSRVDTPCWSGTESTPAHELVHNLGGIQRSAPHATAAGHCYDEWDLMCYADGPGVELRLTCEIGHRQLLDCRGDDYFNTAPARGSYLDAHWNTARSSFLDNVTADRAGGARAWWGAVTAARRGRAALDAALHDDSGTPVAGATVLLQTRLAGEGTWHDVDDALTTDGSGLVAATVPRTHPAWYRFVFRGDATRAQSTSDQVLVKAGSRATIAWKARKKRVVGRLVDSDGNRLAGERVTLQRRAEASRRWIVVASRTTSAKGTVSLKVRRARTYRFVYAGSNLVLADRSPTVRAGR